MRSIPAEFQARLDSGATTMCRCWLVSRRDGVKLGFTDHDCNLVFGGVVYHAGAGMDASAIEATTGLSVDNGQVSGALRADCLNETDIAAGLFDGAEVRQWLVDWTSPDLQVLVFRGSIGEIKRGKLAFEAELRGLAEGLNKPVGRAYLRNCDARLGDARCGVDLNLPGFTAECVVANQPRGDAVLVTGAEAFAEGWFTGGEAVANGQRLVIREDRLTAQGRLIGFGNIVGLGVGSVVELTAGCDGRKFTCGSKFNNFINFRGFPHLPGEDWVVSYPQEGDRLDGGSLYND